MGAVCTIVREPGPNDLWIYEENATINFGNDTHYLIRDFEASILNQNACRSSWSKFEPATQTSLTVAYLVLIAFGSLGNGLVCYVVLANCHMRTPRNLLILNLATSDLILCLFTQPFNLLKSSANVWKLGILMCKLVPMAAGTNVFVSTFSITAIALDRFKLIVRPTDRDLLLQPAWSAAVLVSIWVLSLILSSPMLVFNKIKHLKITTWLCVKEYCFEDPQYSNSKAAYSIASMLIQYILPIIVLSVAHARICNKLQNRMVAANQSASIGQQQSSDGQSAKRQQIPLIQRTAAVESSNNLIEKDKFCKENENVLEIETHTKTSQTSQNQTSVTLKIISDDDKCKTNDSSTSERYLNTSSEKSNLELTNSSTLISTCADESTIADSGKVTFKFNLVPTVVEPRSTEISMEGNILQDQNELSPTSRLQNTSSSLISTIKSRVYRLAQSISPNRNSRTTNDEHASGAVSEGAENVNRSLKARKRRADRERKTNRLLVMIAVLFAGSWMPLNIMNIVADLNPNLITSLDQTGIIFAVCNLLVLGSACANPVLYGWLNENFQREFKRILCVKCCVQSQKSSACCLNSTIASRQNSKTTNQRNSEHSTNFCQQRSDKVKKALIASGPPNE